MSESVNVSINGHLAVVTLNRPDKANAVSLEMFDALGDAGEGLARDASIRAIVLQGAGANFCAGIDVSIFGQDEVVIDAKSLAPGGQSPANRFQRAAYVWRELPVPVICAITGVAYGAGLQIALGADLRYATADARLSIMEIKWGLIPDMGGTLALRELMHRDQAMKLAMTAAEFSGTEALELGLATGLDSDPLTTARSLAEIFKQRSPDAVAASKKLYRKSWSGSPGAALARETLYQARILSGANQRIAVRRQLGESVDFQKAARW